MTTSHGKVIHLAPWYQRMGIKWDMIGGWLTIAAVDLIGWLLVFLVAYGLGTLAKAVLP